MKLKTSILTYTVVINKIAPKTFAEFCNSDLCRTPGVRSNPG